MRYLGLRSQFATPGPCGYLGESQRIPFYFREKKERLWDSRASFRLEGPAGWRCFNHSPLHQPMGEIRVNGAVTHRPGEGEGPNRVISSCRWISPSLPVLSIFSCQPHSRCTCFMSWVDRKAKRKAGYTLHYFIRWCGWRRSHRTSLSGYCIEVPWGALWRAMS